MSTLQITQEKNLLPISDIIDSRNYYEINNMNEVIPVSSLSVSEALSTFQSWYQAKKKPFTQIIENLDAVREAIGRMAERTDLEMHNSERGQELLAFADEYCVPYDKKAIDWLQLIDDVADFKYLKQQNEEEEYVLYHKPTLILRT